MMMLACHHVDVNIDFMPIDLFEFFLVWENDQSAITLHIQCLFEEVNICPKSEKQFGRNGIGFI
jgi:hypothetical protein